MQTAYATEKPKLAKNIGARAPPNANAARSIVASQTV